MNGHKSKRRNGGNGVVPSEADLQASGSWGLPLLGITLVLTLVLVSVMAGSGDASAFFGH
jgi:multidrug efflux pump subunit AcrB